MKAHVHRIGRTAVAALVLAAGVISQRLLRQRGSTSIA